MSVVHSSWLYINDTRNYPFTDEAVLGSTQGLVDFHIAFPKNLKPVSKRVYVSSLVVSNGIAELTVSLEDYGELGTIQAFNPDPYRMYQIVGSASNINGFASFGAAIREGTDDVSETHTADTGCLLESLVHRYEVSDLSKLQVHNTSVVGSVTFKGSDGVVCEIENVYYDEEDSVVPSLVIRLEHDRETMLKPVPSCKRYLESGSVEGTDLIDTINNVRPDSNGILYLKFTGGATFNYDEDGYLILDSDGSPSYNLGTPVLNLVSELGQINVLAFKDNYSYKQNCKATKNANKTIVYYTNVNLMGQPAKELQRGIDGQGGNHIPFAGAYVRDNKLYVLWYFTGTGDLQAGPNIDGLRIVVDEEAAGVTANHGSVSQGTAPVLPGHLTVCTGKHSSAGELGKIGLVEYSLSRPMTNDEKFAIDIPANAVQDDSEEPEGNVRVKTPEFAAQDPDSELWNEDD